MSSEDFNHESRSMALTPTWSVATVLSIFVFVSLLLERAIHRLSHSLKKMNSKPLLAAVDRMKEEMMLLGFISLLLAAACNGISSICIPSKLYNGAFHPCSEPIKNQEIEDTKLRLLNESNENNCKKGYEPFVSDHGLEQLHRFIFVMAITHVSYVNYASGYSEGPHMEEMGRRNSNGLAWCPYWNETMRRQSAIVKFHMSNPLVRNALGWFVSFGNLAVQLFMLIILRCMKPFS